MSEEGIIVKCIHCGIMFRDKLYKKEYGTAKRIYCNKCVDELRK